MTEVRSGRQGERDNGGQSIQYPVGLLGALQVCSLSEMHSHRTFLNRAEKWLDSHFKRLTLAAVLRIQLGGFCTNLLICVLNMNMCVYNLYNSKKIF